jgi:hypothetical protein
MFSPVDPKSEFVSSLDLLDRVAIGYLTLPLLIFLAGMFEWWAALPLIACTAYALKPLIANWPVASTRMPVTSLQLGVAVVVGCGWAVCGGTDHLVFTNADWHIRDAVLHDLVNSPWPVGYGLLDGVESMLRAPIAYYLPAALIGKGMGLAAAHMALAAWTATGATLFLLQVLSLTPSRLRVALLVAGLVVIFSGLDIVGSLLNAGPRFRSDWNITTHLEWWAGSYQYSSMTTQLFWVPNHALGGWLIIGLLYRDNRFARLDSLLPILVVAAALWSPLSAIGVVPFVLWKVVAGVLRQRSLGLLRSSMSAPALCVGIVVAAYLLLDPSRIPKGWALGSGGADDTGMALVRQAQFFLLEAGIIGLAILMIRRSTDVMLALLILAVLPFAYFGSGNDFVMRASIPSLAVLSIGACLALTKKCPDNRGSRKKMFLGGLLVVGAMTPVSEFARAVMLPVWPINMRATLIGADCGNFPPHYVARLGTAAIAHLLRRPHRIALGPQGPVACDNPAFDLTHPEAPMDRKRLTILPPIESHASTGELMRSRDLM